MVSFDIQHLHTHCCASTTYRAESSILQVAPIKSWRRYGCSHLPGGEPPSLLLWAAWLKTLLCRLHSSAVLVNASKGVLLGVVLFHMVVATETTEEHPLRDAQRPEERHLKEDARRHPSLPLDNVRKQREDLGQTQEPPEKELESSSRRRSLNNVDVNSFAECQSPHHGNSSVVTDATLRSTFVVGTDDVWARLTQAALQPGQCPSSPCCHVSEYGFC